ncbi:MAG: TolC family outer membrane protein [Desulfatiglandales bacterium]
MFRLLRYCFAVAFVFFLFHANIAVAETLQDAIGHVLQTNPEIRANAYNRLARDQEVKKAESGYYPSIDITAGVGINDHKHPFRETMYPRSTVLGLRQNLYSFGLTTNEVRRQKSRVKSQAHLLQANSEYLALQTARVFLNVLRAMELHELAQENLVNHQKIYDQMKLRAESGVDRKADLDQVVGRLALAQSNIVVTQANLEDARTNYFAVVGRSPQDLDKPDPVDSDFPREMEHAVELALDNYPLIKSAKEDLEARRYQFKAAKSDAYPTIDLTADYRWEHDVDQPGYGEEFSASVMLRFNLFRGGYDKARISETRFLIKEAEEIYNNTERETIQSIQLSWEAYIATNEKVNHLEEYVEATGMTMDAFSKQWMVGRRTMFDVLDTQAEYINAKSDLVEASYDKTYSEYRVLSGMGKLVHTLGLEWPEESN